ncbi:hypothetical protein KBC04_04480 [Candidatus Babeliales bacterium]|nr:hypothetical protein [Candidatus Babeliales bacterium]MBP9844077.1 hypothetical protein [Candidatus Babeliales bacterium]
MKNQFFACLMLAASCFGSDNMKKKFNDNLNGEREKDSVFYRGAEDMLGTACLIGTLPLIGYQSSAVTIPVTVASGLSLAALKAVSSEDEPIGTQKGLQVSLIPLTVCTVGLTTIGTEPKVALGSCTALYAAFTVMASLKR